MSLRPDHSQHMDGFASPSSPNEANVGPRQKQVPISRSAVSGYERPERARTSHACEPCRERKTKCDGERPSCRRCLHTGTGCHYGYGKGWKKRKTVEDLTVTSRKLARYENLLNEIIPLVPADVRIMIEEARQQEIFPVGTSEGRDSSTPSSNITPDGDHKSMSPASNRLPLSMPIPPSQSSITNVHAPRSIPLTSIATSPPLQSPPMVAPLVKSPADDLSSNSALRLPSIARNGMLLERAAPSSTGLVQLSPTPPLPQALAQSPSSIVPQSGV